MKNLGWVVLALSLVCAEGCNSCHLHPHPPPADIQASGDSSALLDASNPYALKCGSIYCDARSTYCETIKTDVAELPSNYSCKPLPESCRAASGQSLTCACFPAGTVGDFCSVVDQNGTPGFRRTTVGGR